MASSHTNQGPLTPGRKARRSWFDTPPLTHLDPLSAPGQHVSKRQSLDVVETLTLTHFTNPPRITFGKAVIGKTKLRTLLLRNPHDFEQEVIVERFPYKKKFMVNKTRFTVDAESTTSLEITWAPEEAGGYREMVLFHINDVYRLQAFLIGSADKPKLPRKFRKFPLGPCIRQPPTVVQTSALSSIRTSYSPNSRQLATELLEDMQSNLQDSVENKENSGSKKTDSPGSRKIQEGGVLKLSRVSPVNETVIVTAAVNPVTVPTKATTEEDGFKTPTPLESTTIVGKQEIDRACLRNRRQWKNISDITSPTLNMSPIPVNEGTEHGLTVDSYFQANETCNLAIAKADKLPERVRNKNVKRNLIERMPANGAGMDLKDTFVVPLVPAMSTKVTSKLCAAEDNIFVVSRSGAAVSAVHQRQSVQADETRIITENKTLQKIQSPLDNHLSLSEQLPSDFVNSIETSANLNRNHLGVSKNTEISPPKIPRDAFCDPTQVSPRTMLDESLTLISQVKRPFRGSASSPDDKNSSINSSLISHGQGIVSPNSFMEDMRSMMQNSHCGSGDEHKNTSTPNIASPSLMLNNSIPHNVMVSHLKSVRLSLHESPVAASCEYGTPNKLQKTSFMPKRKSITSQFQKEEKKRIATVAQVFKKDQQSMGDGNKQFSNKYNTSKRHVFKAKGTARSPNLYAAGSPRRETFILKKKEAEGKKAGMRSPKVKKFVLKRSPPKRRSPLRSPHEFDPKRAKNKTGKRKSSPLKPVGRTSQGKKSAARKSDPVMPEIISKIKGNMMMMTSDAVWNLVTPHEHVRLPGAHRAVPCRSDDELKPQRSEIDCFENLLSAENQETDEIDEENTLTKKRKLFPDLSESDCYGDGEEFLAVAENETKVIISDIDRNTTDTDKTREKESLCRAEFEHKPLVSECEPCENNLTKTNARSQADRVVTETDRASSPQRFYTLSPSNLPTSPELYLDQSRRGTITVTKSRPSDALLKAMNNRKRLFQESPQKTPYTIMDDDRETRENISVKFEEHYHEIDGKIYVIVKETTDVVKSTTETYVEQMTVSPQQFDSPVRLPNSPDVLVSRRSTHVVRSPKMINLDSMNRRQLHFFDEGSTVDDEVNLVNDTALGNKELNGSELSEDNCSVIKSDTFEKEPSLYITADLHDMITDDSTPAITSVCSISRRLVNYDDGSETCSTANVTRDSLDTSQSVDSLNVTRTSIEERKVIDEKQVDREGIPFAMDADESIIQLNWEVTEQAEAGAEGTSEPEGENGQDLKNFSRGNGRHLAAAGEESEDEQFYDTMSETYYDAMSDAGNPEAVQIDELKETEISSRYLECTTTEHEAYPALVADGCFGISSAYLCEAEERPECSMMGGRLQAVPFDTFIPKTYSATVQDNFNQQTVPFMDTCAPSEVISATRQGSFDEQPVKTEVSIDHREMFEIIDRKVINLCSTAELQLVDEVVRSTPEAKAKRKHRRSASASDLLESQQISDAAMSPDLSASKAATPRKCMTSSKSAVFKNHPSQVLAKYSPKNVAKCQPPPSKTTQIAMKQRSQSMSNLARQAERIRPVRVEQQTSTAKRIVKKGGQVTQPASKQKSTKGLAQGKLILVKISKTAAPRHPMLFAAKNMYYDERWMEKQERGFVQWLNFVLTPPDEYVAVVNKAKVDARSLSLDDHVTPRLAPTKEILSFRAYAARRRLNRLRRGACELYQSDVIVSVIRKIEVEVESRRISARRDKMMHADVGIKQKLLDLLLHYSPLWLRIGLETIFGEVLMLQSNQDVMGLSRFILTRLLASPDIAAEFAHPTVPHLYKEGYVDSVSRHTVKKFLLLVYFLDKAKLGHLIDHDPCLFCKDAGIKSSKEILTEFSREVLSGEGDITRHLAYLGYTVSHFQRPIDEFDFAVTNLSSDLRDGLRLCRVLEFLAGDHNIMTKLRTPAISRLQKIHNTELFFKALHEQGLDFNLMPGTVTPRDVVDGHREKTLSLLWQLIIHFQSSVLVNETHLKEEIGILTKSLRLKIAMQKIRAFSIEDCQARRDSGDTKLIMENQRLQLIFQWCRLVCLHYGLKIENFTVSFSDGRALCCLLHHYHPALLPLAEIQFETTISLQENAEDRYQQNLEDSMDQGLVAGDCDENNPELFERLLANEKSNYKTLYEKTSALGGVPLMLKSADMSNTIPDEKVVSTFVSYLCARLLDIREEVRAARIIQMAWRRKQLRKAFLEKQRKAKAAVTLQRWFRSLLAKQKRVREAEVQAAVYIQAAWRGWAARLYVARLKQMVQEVEQGDHTELAVTSECQRKWQPQLIQHYHSFLLKQKKVQERDRRREEEAAVIIQKHVRRHRCRKEFQQQQACVIKIQALWRRQLARKKFCMLKKEQIHNSAVVIQKWVRMHVCLMQYRKMRNAAISLQKCWRRRQGRCTLKALRAETFSRATTVIQKLFRGRLEQRKFQKIKQAAVVVQGHWRIKQAKRELVKLKTERENKAANVVQNFMKSIICRQKYIRLRKATVILQKNWREIIAQRKLIALKAERDNRAAVVIQKYLKCYKAQSRYRAQQKSAVLIQSVWRMLRAKKELLELKQKQQENQAAVVIQKNFKRYKAQQLFSNQKKSAVLIQSVWRMLQARRELLELKQKQHERSATVIQCCYRRFRCMQEFQKYRNAAITIQKTWRRHCAKNMLRKLELEKQIQAATNIQRFYRGFIQRRCYTQLRVSAVSLQSWWRMVLAKKLSDRLRRQQRENAALILQRNFKMWMHRSYFLKLKSAAVVLQASWKMLTAHRLFLTLKSMKRERSAVCIQRVWRRYVTRQMLASRKRAASVIQSWWKMVQIKRQYWRMKEAVSLIQAWYRAVVLRNHQRSDFLRQRASAIHIQSWWRSQVLRRKFKTVKHSAVVIQAHFRRFQCRQKFLAVKEAAQVIQRHYRRYARDLEVRKDNLTKKSATVIQKSFRRYLHKRNLKRTAAALVLQTVFRKIQAQRKYLKQRQAALIIQKYFRAHQKARANRQGFLYQKQAALTIQKYFRAHQNTKTARQQFLLQRQGAIIIQATYRAILIRRQYVHIHQSIIKIQALIRGKIMWNRFQKLKHATVTIQVHFRAVRLRKICRESFLQLRTSAVIIQRFYRSRLAERRTLNEVAHQHAAATRIQAVYRGWRQNNKYLLLQAATVMIQQWFRACLAGQAVRAEITQMRQAVCVIEKRFRLHLQAQEARRQAEDLRAAKQRDISRKLGEEMCGFKEEVNIGVEGTGENLDIKMSVGGGRVARRGECEIQVPASDAIIERAGEKYDTEGEINVGNIGFEVGKEEKCEIKEEVSAGGERVESRTEEKWDIKAEVSVVNAGVESRGEEKCHIKGEVIVGDTEDESRREEKCDIAREGSAGGERVESRTEERCDIAREVSLANAGVKSRGEEKCHIKGEVIVGDTEDETRGEKKCDIARELSVGDVKAESKSEEKGDTEGVVSVGYAAIDRTEQKCGIKNEVSSTAYAKVGKTEEMCDAEMQVSWAAEVERRTEETRKEQAAIVIQKVIKGYQTRIKYLESLARRECAARVIQNRWRHINARRHCREDKFEEAVEMQTHFRMNLQRQHYQDNMRSVVALQASVKTFIQRRRHEEGIKHVVRMQRRVRSQQQRRKTRKQFLNLSQDQTSVPDGLTQRCELPEKNRSEVQLPWKLQQQINTSPEFKASDTEQEFMKMKGQMLDKEAAVASQCSGHTYLSCESHTRHLASVNISCAGQTLQDQCCQERNASAVVIQRAVRRYLCRRETVKLQHILRIQASVRQYLGRCHFLVTLRSVVLLQAAVRGWLARRSLAALRKRHQAIICLQAHVRGYFVRKTFSTLLREKIQSMQKQKKDNGAAIMIQARWRGFITRKNTRDRKLTQARKRLKEANKQATEERTLGSRTSSALDFLLREKDVGHILEALMHLEVCTRLSPICCERMVEVNAVPGLYRLISSCNRSVPHMELIKFSVSILLNLAKYEKTISAVLEPENSVTTVVELLHIYREKGAIFNYCCMLLGILGLHPGRRAIILKNPLIVDRLQSIHALSIRKHRLNRNRQVMQAKMAALRSFNCTLPLTASSKCKHRRIKPEWALAGDAIKDFDDPVTAVTFVMDSLQIGPKM